MKAPGFAKKIARSRFYVLDKFLQTYLPGVQFPPCKKDF